MAAEAPAGDHRGDAGDDADAAGAAHINDVTWISIDPRTSDVVPYLAAAAHQLEAARAGGRDLMSFADLPPPSCTFLQGASVEGVTGPRPTQQTVRGRRDVRRFVLRASDEAVVVTIAQDHRHKWRIASTDGHADGFEEATKRQITVRVPPEARVKEDAVGDTPRTPGTVSEAEARKAAAQEASQQGLEAVWEWCRVLRQEAWHDNDSWSLYSEETMDEIEEAFRNGAAQASVMVGLRMYDIVFHGVQGGTQTDSVQRKRRHVRRRVMTPDERQELFLAARRGAVGNEEQGNVPGEGESCALCLQDFDATRLMPVVRLLECAHFFHAACAQQIADAARPCPLCRAAVDWKAALAQCV